MKARPAETRRQKIDRANRGRAGSGLSGKLPPKTGSRERDGGLAAWIHDDAGSLWIAAMLWVAIVYLLVPSEIYTLQGHGADTVGATGTEPSVFYRSIKLVLIALSGLIILWRGGLAWLLLQGVNRLLILCLLLVPLSYFWSIDPATTSARAVSLSFIVFVCYAAVLIGWHRARFQNLLRPILTTLLVASLLFGIFFPDLAIEKGDDVSLRNAWKGVIYQKNAFGLVGSMCAILWFHGFLTKETKPWRAVVGVSIAGLCVLLSRSSSAILATTLTFAFMLMLMFLPGNLRRYAPYIVGTFATIVVVYAVAVLKLVPGLDDLITPIANFFGKDLTFSNRSLIWAIVKEHIELRPWLGSGYGAFWVGPVPSSPSYVFIERMGNFYPYESHNGYIELVNDLGIVGLLAFFGYIIVFIRQSLEVMRIDRNQAVLYLAIFFQQAIGNLTESYWLQVGFGFVVFTLATFCIARALLDDRLKTYFGARAPARWSARAVDRSQ